MKCQENKGKQYIYYKDGANIVLYNTETKKLEKRKRGDTPNYAYELMAGYEATIKGMQAYEKDFNAYCEDLKRSQVEKIIYRKYWNDYGALEITFNRFSDKAIRDRLSASVTMNEVEWIQRCNNGVHSYLDEEYLEKKVQCYGYDYSGFYPWIMSLKLLMIPKVEGKNCILNSIDEIDIRKPGFYRVKVSYTNKNLCKVFQFSKDDTYTHTSIKFLKYIHHNMPKIFKEGDVTLELIQDGKPNAHIYDEWFTGDEVFGKWYDIMSKLKEEQPKNKLIKWLTSGLWGYLSRYKYDYIDDEETFEYEDEEYRFLNVNMYCDEEGNNIHKMINREKPGTRLLLLKPFITSLGRKYLAEAIYKFDPELRNIIRCYCDDLVLRKPIDKIPNTKNFKLLKPEKKTTGILFFKSRGRYYNATEDIYAGQWSEETIKDMKTNFF